MLPGSAATFPNRRRPCTLPSMAVLRGDMAALLAAAAQPPAAAEQARRVLEDTVYQRALPVEAPPAELPRIDLPWLGPLVEILLYVGLAVLAGLAIFWIVNHLVLRRTRDEELAPEEGAAPPLHVRLDQPDRLAATGRFAEAIHQLLLETLGALSRASRLPPAYTSREILASARLPARARAALSGLVLAVEISRFGGAPAGEEDYRACLRRFHEFLESYRAPTESAPEAAA